MDAIKKGLEEIENQLDSLNSKKVGSKWIKLQQPPTYSEIKGLNQMLGFIVKELRTLRETGELNVKELYKKHFGR